MQLGQRRGPRAPAALYRLHAILKVHLAEEQLYLAVLDQNLSDDKKDALARGIDHVMAEPL